jgi:hypothetical protein
VSAGHAIWCSCGWTRVAASDHVWSFRLLCDEVVASLVDDHWAAGHQVRCRPEVRPVLERAALRLAARRRGVT